jgi:hypothetical protein
MDALSISALVVSVITALSGFIAGMHIRKSECMGNKCLCDKNSPLNSPNNSIRTKHIELHTPSENNINV